MLEFQIKAQIHHQCNSDSTFDSISKFFKVTGALRDGRKIALSDFIQYDKEFQFITYNLQRDLHMSLQELYEYSDQKEFKYYINQSQEILKLQNKKFQDNDLHNTLSIKNLDSSKIWFEFNKKSVIDVYILNFVPFANDGKTIEDILNYFDYLLQIKLEGKKKTKANKNDVQKMNQDYESIKQQPYSIRTLEMNYLNKAVNSLYLGISDLNRKIEFKDYFQFIVQNSKKQITKIIEQLKPIQKQNDPVKLLNQLQEIINNKNGSEEKLEFIITKLIQKYNLFDEFFLKNYDDNNQIIKIIKHYLREQIYNCIQEENQQIIPYDKIMIYLVILNQKKSLADLENQIKLMFSYTNERLAIFKHEWSGKIISDQEILNQFLIIQTKILQSKKCKIINKNLFHQTIIQLQTYKERVQSLKSGLDTLKQHFQVDNGTLAKDYFKQYQSYMMKNQNNLVNEDNIISTLFLDLVNQQLNTIINTQNNF
ncbi:unnamed protein product [Paramecium pentaurelia]|uniref:Uncharacterized protein n=1 Tax=Paramecium pentaurelia TaxID=43138 RepID=A0A8S1U5P3_9CILI|nr:unnamed protein product [Paramecium pentaurelia]